MEEIQLNQKPLASGIVLLKNKILFGKFTTLPRKLIKK